MPLVMVLNVLNSATIYSIYTENKKNLNWIKTVIKQRNCTEEGSYLYQLAVSLNHSFLCYNPIFC